MLSWGRPLLRLPAAAGEKGAPLTCSPSGRAALLQALPVPGACLVPCSEELFNQQADGLQVLSDGNTFISTSGY